MKKITFLFLLLYGMILHSQNFEWLRTTEPTTANMHNSDFTAICDPSGNIYATGFKDTPYYYNTVMGNLYFTKYNTAGEIIFSKTFTGKCAINASASDSQGNIIMAIGYLESITFNETIIPAIGPNKEHVMIKLDSDGNFLWYKRMSIDQSDSDLDFVEDFRTIAIDAQDNIYAGYDDFMYSYITKYSPLGDELLMIEQQNVSRVTSVALDSEGNIYAAGGCAKLNAKYAGVDVPTSFDYNSYVVKYSSSGIYQWLKYIDDVTCSNSPYVAVHSPDDIYFSSYLFTTGGFDDIEIEGQQGLSSDIFIAKLNSSGNFLWVREASETGPSTGIRSVGVGNSNYLSLDNAGNIYFAGDTDGTINWGNGISTTAVSPFSDTDAVIVKYSPEGEVLYAKTAGGTSTDQIAGITIDGSGSVFVTGMAVGSVNFDPIAHDAPANSLYSFVAKMTGSTMGTEIPNKEIIFLYPNPSSDNIMITGIEDNIKGSILNTLGQKVSEFEASPTASISVAALTTGTYFIRIEGYKPLKFIKQ